MCNKILTQSSIGQLTAMKSRLPLESPVIELAIQHLRVGSLLNAIDCVGALFAAEMPATTQRSVVALHNQLTAAFEDGE